MLSAGPDPRPNAASADDSSLREFVENVAVAMNRVAPDGTIIWANAAELAMLGYEREEYIGRSMTDFHAERDVARDLVERLKQREEVCDYEARLVCKDGTLLDVAITSNVAVRDGEFLHTRCVTRPIRQSRRSLEVQARLAAIVESSDDAIVSKDLSGIIQSWNSGAERMFGYTAEEAIGRHISLIAPPDRIGDIARLLAAISRGERVHHFETNRRAKDGRILSVSLSVSPIRDANGTIIGASKIARDITEQKRLLEAQARLAAIIESADDAIISKDLEGNIQSWNRGAERIFGYTAAEVIGKHISMLAAAECVDEIPTILARLRNGERVEHYITRRRTKDGRILTVSLTISPVRDTTGRIIAISKIARDVTEQVRNEEGLRAANEALARSNADLEQFAYSASHDLQEPLRTIASFTGMLRKRYGGQLGPEADEYIRFTIEGVKRMHQLLQDLLDYTRATTEATGDADERVDVGAVLAAVLDDLKVAIEDSGGRVTFEQLPFVRAHAPHVHQILQNLIANAVRYRSDVPPEIQVTAEKRGTEWMFSVRDNGIGVPPEYHEQIFGMFKRLSTQHPGTGIGLAICRRLVQRAHGRIWVESKPGQGSVFFFTLPE